MSRNNPDQLDITAELKKYKLYKYDDKITAKKILDKWASVVLDKDSIWINSDGEAQPNQDKHRQYNEKGYLGTEVLWGAPDSCLRLEFENERDTNVKIINHIVQKCKELDIDFCVTDHGGKSPYVNIFDLPKLKKADDYRNLKMALVDALIYQDAKTKLDRTNLGKTLTPVIEHPHWKPKYNGAVHKITAGKNPLEHTNDKNPFILELVKNIEKARNRSDKVVSRLRAGSDRWIEDFLTKYCCENSLPSGARHAIICKNLAILCAFRKDGDEIIKRYSEKQRTSTKEVYGWVTAVLKGEVDKVSPGELINYIKDNNIPYAVSNFPAIMKPEQILDAPITTAEKDLLYDKDLLTRINKEFDKKIEGEHNARISIFLNGCGRWVKNHALASYNLCINSNSGAGKDHSTKSVLSIFPKSMVITRTRISPTAFTYWHNNEAGWTWDGKILYLSDISNGILNSDVFKVMCSEGSCSTVVINQEAIDIEIHGKPIMYITIAFANPNNEILRRFPFLDLNESKIQTQAIMRRQAQSAIVGKSNEFDPMIRDALSRLEIVQVRIPYAHDLPEYFPSGHIIMRTHFTRFLDYIKASAALYQFQRLRDPEGYVLAEGQDYDNACIVLKATTSNALMVPLTKKQKDLLDLVKNRPSFSVSDIESDAAHLYVQSKLYVALAELTSLGFLRSHSVTKEDSKKAVRTWTYVPMSMGEIPTWEEICRKKGNEGKQGNEGKEGIKGNDKDIDDKLNNMSLLTENSENNNSLNSLNSPYLLGNEKKNIFENLWNKHLDTRQIMDANAFVTICESAGLTKPDVTYFIDLYKNSGEPKIIEKPSGYYLKV